MTETLDKAVEVAFASFALKWPNIAEHAPQSFRLVFRKALSVAMTEVAPGLPLSQKEMCVLRESLWHSVQLSGVSDEERAMMHELRAKLADAIVPG